MDSLPVFIASAIGAGIVTRLFCVGANRVVGLIADILRHV